MRRVNAATVNIVDHKLATEKKIPSKEPHPFEYGLKTRLEVDVKNQVRPGQYTQRTRTRRGKPVTRTIVSEG